MSAGIVLQIGVHRDQHLAARGVDAGGHRGCLAVVSAQGDDTNSRIDVRDLAQDLQTAVGRAIVDVNDLRGTPEFPERVVEPRVQRAEVWLFVVDRKKD